MVIFTQNNLKTLEKRYLLRDSNNKIIETPYQLFDRVVNTICGKDDTNKQLKQNILEMMHDLRFLPNTPTLMNAGTTNMLSACFVINIDDTLESIVHDAGWQQAFIHKMGGGVGMNFSKLRPKGDVISTTGGITTGVLGFLPIFNELSESIRQGGKRDGANMGILSISHPEIEDWILAKVGNDKFKNFNLSILIDDKFMRTLKEDGDWALHFNGKTYKTLKAKYLFNLIATSAHSCGCPGVIFVDEINKNNPLANIMTIDCTNPCVTEDTWIMTTSGPNQVKNLINEKFTAVVNGYSKDPILLDEYKSNGFFKTGEKDVYLIKTFEGFEVKLTEDHLVLIGNIKSSKFKKVKELTPEDTIVINDHYNGNISSWEGYGYSEREGYLLGLLIGDGHINKEGIYHLQTWGESDGAKNIRTIAYNYEKTFCHRSDFEGWYPINRKDTNDINRCYDMKCVSLRKICQKLNVTYENKIITPEIEKCSYDFCKNVIKGLFDSDATVNKDKMSIELSQSNINMLKTVQRILLRFGIYSIIYENRRHEQDRMMPDGKGGSKEYHCKAQHGLGIIGTNAYKYYNKIGFNDSDKTKKLENNIKNWKGKKIEDFSATIKEIIYIGKKEVYDATIANIHSFDGNGFILHNCGEMPLYVGYYNNELIAESCNLGSLNLSKYCTRKTTESFKYEFDTQQYINDIHNAVEFLDLVIDANKYPFDFIDKGTKLTRKIGLGTTGLSECLIKLRIEYGSKESIKFIEKIFEILQRESHKKSEELGKIKNYYPIYYNTDVKATLPARRNLFTTTIAPNGTTGRFMAGHPYSSGIEPPPAICMSSNIIESKIEDGIHPLLIEILKERIKYNPETIYDIDDILQKIKENGKSIQYIEEIPKDIRNLFKVAEEISIEDHIKIQSAVQKYIDNAVSKTINMPNSATIDDVKKAYTLAHENHCKGVTIYRDKCKDHQVFESTTKATKTVPIKSCPCPIEDLSPRPEILGSLSFTKKTACNTLFITPTYLGDTENSTLEALISSNGGCVAMRNGLAITISVYQRLLEMIDPTIAKKGLEILTSHLQKISCQTCIKGIEVQKHKENVKHPIDAISCPAAVGDVLKYMLDHKVETFIDGKLFTEEVNKKCFNIDFICKDENLNLSTSKRKCPECGNTLLFKQEGCMNDSCICGWGGCN